MFNVSLEGQDALIQRLDAMPASVQAALRVKVAALSAKLQGHVIHDKLHGQVLNQRSGALARSIQREVSVNDGEVIGRVYSSGDVKYAKIHEFGGTTPAHEIVPKKGDALAFMAGGKLTFATVVHHPGSKIPERSFMRSSLADMAEEITKGLRDAMVEGINKP